MDAIFGGVAEDQGVFQEGQSFGDVHFGAAQLGDKERVRNNFRHYD